MKRHTEAWRDSLRYGVPQMDKMPGLRRVTLNNNPLLANEGALALAEALKDDLWLKAIFWGQKPRGSTNQFSSKAIFWGQKPRGSTNQFSSKAIVWGQKPRGSTNQFSSKAIFWGQKPRGSTNQFSSKAIVWGQKPRGSTNQFSSKAIFWGQKPRGSTNQFSSKAIFWGQKPRGNTNQFISKAIFWGQKPRGSTSQFSSKAIFRSQKPRGSTNQFISKAIFWDQKPRGSTNQFSSKAIFWGQKPRGSTNQFSSKAIFWGQKPRGSTNQFSSKAIFWGQKPRGSTNQFSSKAIFWGQKPRGSTNQFSSKAIFWGQKPRGSTNQFSSKAIFWGQKPRGSTNQFSSKAIIWGQKPRGSTNQFSSKAIFWGQKPRGSTNQFSSKAIFWGQKPRGSTNQFSSKAIFWGQKPRALDLHGTGISTSGAGAFMEVLKYNTTIEVLDLRRNPLIDRSVLRSVMENLMTNCNSKDTEFQWIEPPKDEQKTPGKAQRSRRKTTKILNNSIGKKTTIKITPSSGHRRSKSTSSVGMSRREVMDSMKPTPGLPWRTAARANRYRGCPPERTPRKPSEDVSETDTTSIMVTREDSCVDRSLEALAELDMLEEDRINAQRHRRREHEIKMLQVEVEQMRRVVKEEREARANSDNRVMKLMMENRRLEDDVRIMKLRTSLSADGAQAESQQPDDSFIEGLELTVRQFHDFLDKLREAGLEQLITMAGLTDQQMSVSRSLLKSPPKSRAGLSAVRAPPPAPRHVQRSDNLRPGSAGSRGHGGGHTMGHIDDSAYLREKAEADEVYQRLVRQTSAAFTSGVTAADPVPITPLTHPSGDIGAESQGAPTPREQGQVSPSSPHVDSPSDPLSGCQPRDPTPTLDSEKGLKCPNEEPSPRPLPPPRHKSAASREERKGEGGTVGRAPSRTSDANYSMDSFISEREEVIVLGDDADLLESPNSRPLNMDSDEDDF
ncbi:hypothetical protein ACOMHN_022411 [Nucella lapillus]